MATIEITSDLPVWQMTAGQLARLVREAAAGALAEARPQEPQPSAREPRFAHSLQELADALGVSKWTANNIKQSGVIDDAVVQWQRSLTINIDKAMALIAMWHKSGHNEKKFNELKRKRG